MIQLSIERTQLQLGEAVRGVALWTPEAGENPRHVFAKVLWRTEGRGIVNTATLWEQRVPAAGLPIQIPIDVALPLDGPISYDGNLLRILWEVVVGLDLPMRKDPEERVRLLVLPRSIAAGPFVETPVPERAPW